MTSNNQFLIMRDQPETPFGSKRREDEKKIILSMASLYCRTHGEKENKKPISYYLNEKNQVYFLEVLKHPSISRRTLCEECATAVIKSTYRIEHCRHMEYKTLCHHCPTPCHQGSLKNKMTKFMQKRKILLCFHPVLSMGYMYAMIKASQIQKNERKKLHENSSII